jgi:hypothetical protein
LDEAGAGGSSAKAKIFFAGDGKPVLTSVGGEKKVEFWRQNISIQQLSDGMAAQNIQNKEVMARIFQTKHLAVAFVAGLRGIAKRAGQDA